VARFFADENFPIPVVEELRRLGHDTVTMDDAGLAGQSLPDEEVVDRATADGRAVLTLNRRDFIRIHGMGRRHAGIVVCTFDLDFPGQANRIHAEILHRADLPGQLVRVNRPQR
jgi:hypothetical protein